MVKKVVSFVTLMVVSVLLLTGCGLRPAPAAEKSPIRVEYTIWEGDYTLLVAQDKGFFEKHGVQVEPVFYETFANAVPDMAVNRIDIGLFAVGDLLNITRIADVKGVAVYDSGGTSMVVSQKNIRDIKDLRGKKVGVNIGSTGEIVVRQMLSSASMSVSDVELVEVDPEMVVNRLSDDLAAGYVWAPYDTRAVQSGHKVLYSRGAIYSLFPDVIVVREAFAKDRPEDVRAFLDAWFEALEYRLANPEESNQIVAEKTAQKVEDIVSSPELQLFNRADNLLLFDQSDQNDSTIFYSAKVNLDFLVMRGSMTLRPDIHTILDPSFLQ